MKNLKANIFMWPAEYYRYFAPDYTLHPESVSRHQNNNPKDFLARLVAYTLDNLKVLEGHPWWEHARLLKKNTSGILEATKTIAFRLNCAFRHNWVSFNHSIRYCRDVREVLGGLLVLLIYWMSSSPLLWMIEWNCLLTVSYLQLLSIPLQCAVASPSAPFPQRWGLQTQKNWPWRPH